MIVALAKLALRGSTGQVCAMVKVVLLNKPWGVLTQFRDADGRPTLAEFVQDAGLYPAGRLDRDSEGLVVLTDDGRLQARISQPQHKTAKTYFVQVEGIPDQAALGALRVGVALRDGTTRPAEVEAVAEPDWLWPRDPPVRLRKTVPDRWIRVTISEGRNRQVRRMTAAVGHPTLRLIRWSVGAWTLDGLALGECRSLDAGEIAQAALGPAASARRRLPADGSRHGPKGRRKRHAP